MNSYYNDSLKINQVKASTQKSYNIISVLFVFSYVIPTIFLCICYKYT